MKARSGLVVSRTDVNSRDSRGSAGPFETDSRRFATPCATPRSGGSEGREGDPAHAHRDDRTTRALRVLALVEARALLSSALDRYGVADDADAEAIVERAIVLLAEASTAAAPSLDIGSDGDASHISNSSSARGEKP